MRLPWTRMRASSPGHSYALLKTTTSNSSTSSTSAAGLRRAAPCDWIRRCCWRILAAIFVLAAIDLFICRDRLFQTEADHIIASLSDATWQRLDGAHPPSQTDLAHHEIRADSAFIMLCRNEDLYGVLQSMSELEASFNSKFHYPWIFFNNVPFTDEFKDKTQRMTARPIRYEVIPDEHWAVPAAIDLDRFHEAAHNLSRAGVKYGDNLSYRQMCRWNSGFFYKHPALADVRYYWRVEPDVHFYTNVTYDVFQYMADNRFTYGFTISVLDDPLTIKTLWPTTLDFLAQDPSRLHANNSWSYLTVDTENSRGANGYSTCHFWSNFEVGDLSFFRGELYESYFQHLDATNNFFYERWGDAPVHSVAIGLFADKHRVHWFHDIGYKHYPYANCPNDAQTSRCLTNTFAPAQPWLNSQDCRQHWFANIDLIGHGS